MKNTQKIWTLLLFFSILVAMAPVLAQEEGYVTVFRKNEWVHVSVGGNTIGSIAWEQYGEDVQLVFYAYNDTGLSFNEKIIDANVAETDTFNKFQVLWKGEITAEGQIKLILSSGQGQITTIVEKFGGEAKWGRPGTSYKHPVATHQGEMMDVFIDDEHKCSFEWTYETVDNETVPQLTVYSADGQIDSTGILTSTYVSVVEFFDQVGFMYERMDADEGYVKWILYSGYELEVRIGQGFGSKPLPFFKVIPADLDVYPGELVTVEFTLPEGVTEYEASWEDKEISEHIKLDKVTPYQDQHEVTFRFLDSAKGQKFTLKVSCDNYGTLYQGKAKIEVLVPLLEKIFWGVVGLGVFIVAVIIFLWWAITRRPGTVSTIDAVREST